MSTKKVNLTEKILKTATTAKTSIKKANDYALNTTEEVITETIIIASQWQKVTEKALKGSVKLVSNQQNLIFDTLDTYKSHFIYSKKRFQKIFAS